jgi:hypothetical protein
MGCNRTQHNMWTRIYAVEARPQKSRLSSGRKNTLAPIELGDGPPLLLRPTGALRRDIFLAPKDSERRRGGPE